MSNIKEKINSEINDYYKKNSQLNKASLISYIEEDETSLIELMKKGYKEMANLNLEISESGFASYLNDANEYESWLFGV